MAYIPDGKCYISTEIKPSTTGEEKICLKYRAVDDTQNTDVSENAEISRYKSAEN